MSDLSRKFLIGLIGEHIGGTRSPAMHEREAAANGLKLFYLIYDFAMSGRTAQDLPRMLEAGKLLGFAGFNVTHPFKQAVIEHLDEVDPAAARIGAVNTVAIREGRTIGFNTDATGFRESLKAGLPNVHLDTVLQIGAGGAGSAVAQSLIESGVRTLFLNDVDAERASALRARIIETHPKADVRVTSELPEPTLIDGVVNATPIGMDSHPGMPLSANWLQEEMWIADVIYFPAETQLLRHARGIGCRTMSGMGMVAFQAAAAFAHFTGTQANGRRMLRRLREEMELGIADGSMRLDDRNCT